MRMLRKFFTDKDNKVVIFQAPNAPIVFWFVFFVVSKLLRPGEPQLWAGSVRDASLLTWAILEIGWGASYFRRGLGLMVAALLVTSKF